MLRGLVRAGIAAVARGDDPPFPDIAPGRPIPTYCQDTVAAIPPDAEDDRDLLARFGRAVADTLMSSDGLSSDAREAALRALPGQAFGVAS